MKPVASTRIKLQPEQSRRLHGQAHTAAVSSVTIPPLDGRILLR